MFILNSNKCLLYMKFTNCTKHTNNIQRFIFKPTSIIAVALTQTFCS